MVKKKINLFMIGELNSQNQTHLCETIENLNLGET